MKEQEPVPSPGCTECLTADAWTWFQDGAVDLLMVHTCGSLHVTHSFYFLLRDCRQSFSIELSLAGLVTLVLG